MKNIEIDDELYQHIVKNTQQIGESASSILRRLLSFETKKHLAVSTKTQQRTASSKKKSDANGLPKLQLKDSSQKFEHLLNYIHKEKFSQQRGVVGKFLLILTALHHGHVTSFDRVIEIRGKGRLYFGKNADELEASGSSTKPKQIGQSPFWVITNTNTTRKKMILNDVAKELGYDEADAEKISELLPPAKKKSSGALKPKKKN